MEDNQAAVTIDYPSLWTIFTFIRTNWGTNDNVGEKQFELILNYRIELNSVYTNYYQETVTEFNLLQQKYGDQQSALKMLFQENQQPTPKITNIANYVLKEFFTMNVAFGGFKAIGYKNYRAWMGGGNFNQNPPPYRTAQVNISNKQGAKS
ncbi:MAG: hypothetical protein ACSHW0_00905 [Thalassotalea sp.]